MERQGEQVHVTHEEARAASTPNIVRYVLIVSLALAIAALSAIWIIGAVSTPQGSHAAAISNQAPPNQNAGQQ